MVQERIDLILDTATLAGRIMLKSGAEMRRTEETVKRIAKVYGVDIQDHIFTLTNGIFVSTEAADGEARHAAMIRQVSLSSAKLNRIIAVNQLSHDIEKGKYTLEQTRERLTEIENMEGWPNPVKAAAAGVGAAAFAVLFGGGMTEALTALPAGALSYYVSLMLDSHVSKIMNNAIGGALMALIVILIVRLFPSAGIQILPAIAGAMMPLVPGMAFTNGFRDIAEGDYLSGAERLLDAVLVGMSIAGGTAVMLMLLEYVFQGGIAL